MNSLAKELLKFNKTTLVQFMSQEASIFMNEQRIIRSLTALERSLELDVIRKSEEQTWGKLETILNDLSKNIDLFNKETDPLKRTNIAITLQALEKKKQITLLRHQALRAQESRLLKTP